MILIWSQKTKKPALGWSCRTYSVVGRMSPGGSRRSTPDHHGVTGRCGLSALCCDKTFFRENFLENVHRCVNKQTNNLLSDEHVSDHRPGPGPGHGPPVCHSSLVSPGSSSITTEHPMRSMTTVVMHHGMFPWRHRIFDETLCV